MFNVIVLWLLPVYYLARIIYAKYERQITVVLVEQYLDFVREFGHEFYIMDRGQVVANVPREELTEEIVDLHLTV